MKDFFSRFRNSGRVVVNGEVYKGQTVSIVNGRVIVDGVEQAQKLGLQVSVNVEGPVENLETASGDVSVQGTVGNVQTTSGDVRCDSIQGNVQTASGDVTAKSIAGSVRTVSGDISR